jgi:RNA polymerase sigma factor (sigma-70 family)
MSTQVSSESAARSLPRDIDIQRLHDAQAYLRCRQQRQPASAAEEKAWRWFCHTYELLVAHWAKAYHLTCEELDDCLQEIRLDVFKHLPSFVSDGTERAVCSWLRTIVQAKAVDSLRYKKRHPFKRLGSAEEAILMSRSDGPAAENEDEHRQEVLLRVLGRLRQKISPMAFQAFSLHWLEKKSIANIANALNSSERAVRRHLSKAKGLFALLAKSDDEMEYLVDD